jgi:hypothetical protein
MNKPKKDRRIDLTKRYHRIDIFVSDPKQRKEILRKIKERINDR